MEIQLVRGEEGGYELVSNVDLTELLGDMTNVYANIGDVNVILKVIKCIGGSPIKPATKRLLGWKYSS